MILSSASSSFLTFMDWSEHKGSFHRSPRVLWQLSFLWYSVLSTLATLSSTDSLYCLLIVQSLLGFPEHPSLCCGLKPTSTQSSDSTKGLFNVILSLRHHCPLLSYVQCHAVCCFIDLVSFSLVPDECINIVFTLYSILARSGSHFLCL